MRNLTIRRNNSVVGSLGTSKIFIEDYTSNENMINNIPCRKLGDLKNGEEMTFQIGDEAAKVFVISDELSKNFSNDFFQIPAGPFDVFLSGENKFNPGLGNAFQFDNNVNAAALANRKKGKRVGIIITVIAVIVGLLIGLFVASRLFLNRTAKERLFYDEAGMSVTLTTAFKKATFENFNVSYVSNDVAMFALKEDFSMYEGLENLTLEEYGKLVIQNNGLESTELEKYGDLLGFKFTRDDGSNVNYYDAFVFKSDSSFWLVQFATIGEQNHEKYSPQILEWAKSIHVFN